MRAEDTKLATAWFGKQQPLWFLCGDAAGTNQVFGMAGDRASGPSLLPSCCWTLDVLLGLALWENKGLLLLTCLSFLVLSACSFQAQGKPDRATWGWPPTGPLHVVRP